MTIDVDELPNKEEQLLQLGEEADALLKADVFNKTVNGLVDTTFQNFCNSKPEETEVRERSYQHYRALVDIVSTLQQRVQIKDGILNKAEQTQGNEQDHE